VGSQNGYRVRFEVLFKITVMDGFKGEGGKLEIYHRHGLKKTKLTNCKEKEIY
jgi:hypothetical protein